jgi:ABC-2 type transport system permease protein
MSLRAEMEEGTIESIFLTPTKPFTLIFAYMLFGFFFGLLPFIIVIPIGALVWNVFIGNLTIFTIIILFLSGMLMMGFGMIFAGLTFWVKKIGETVPLVQSIAMFFSGVFFPITTLPGSLQQVAKFVPFYYPIEGLRKSLISTTPTSEMIGYVFILVALSITFIILGILALNKGVNKAKRDGTLAYY